MKPKYASEIHTIRRFYARSLKNFRDLYIYLPPSYGLQPERHYPVLYMHDGQNIFDGSSSYSGSGWEMHRVTDDLIARQQIEEILIVGIAHQNDQRLSEYAHTDGSFEGHPIKGKGLLYEAFLIEDVKPFIEANYRVLSGPENTALMGSSMGGLVTFNIGLRHPKLFGKLGVVSPSFWWGGDATLKQVSKLSRNQLPVRLWIDMGDSEGPFMEGFTEVIQALLSKGISPQEAMAHRIVHGAIHSEADWMRRVHCPLLYFFGLIGYPERMELHGRDLIGVEGAPCRINPVVFYSSGFSVTPHPVVFESSSPVVLTVDAENTLCPHEAGVATLTARWEHLKVCRQYSVIPSLPSEVMLTIKVSVPEDTTGDSVYLGTYAPDEYILEETEEGFVTQLTLKRDTLFSFKFTQGSWGNVEKDRDGRDISARRILIVEDATVHFTVESW